MMRPRDPRVRQTINQISHNLESANETAQEGLYNFSHHYIFPCFAAIGNCVYGCTAPCLPSREDHLRRRRRRYADFDFYDDWDNDDVDDTILGWGTDELDRLLAGSGLARGSSEQPRRPRKMSYGARRTSRRKSALLIPDDRNDPTVIPSSSFLGFLERFPWRFGARGLKYRPSAADLQEHPTGLRRHVHEESPLLETAEEADAQSAFNGRYRSSTQSSRETQNSLSSRGDLIPSDEEEDAVPLDDEFAMALASRRGTGLSDDQNGDQPESMRSASGTFSLATTTSSKGSKKKKKKKKKSGRMRSPQNSYVEVSHDVTPISITDLKKEEEQVELEEESEIVRKRLAARQLAINRGIGQDKRATSQSRAPHSPTISSSPAHHDALNTPQEFGGEYESTDDHAGLSDHQSNSQAVQDDQHTEPFPPFPLTPSTAYDSGVPTPASQTNSANNPSNSSAPVETTVSSPYIATNSDTPPHLTPHDGAT